LWDREPPAQFLVLLPEPGELVGRRQRPKGALIRLALGHELVENAIARALKVAHLGPEASEEFTRHLSRRHVRTLGTRVGDGARHV